MGRAALADPVTLLADHAFLGEEAAANALDLMTRWPESGHRVVETMTGVARDEAPSVANRCLPRAAADAWSVGTGVPMQKLCGYSSARAARKSFDRLLVSALI
jgi:tRNA-(ms[2]io[6]A)-hydroxylase